MMPSTKKCARFDCNNLFTPNPDHMEVCSRRCGNVMTWYSLHGLNPLDGTPKINGKTPRPSATTPSMSSVPPPNASHLLPPSVDVSHGNAPSQTLPPPSQPPSSRKKPNHGANWNTQLYPKDNNYHAVSAEAQAFYPPCIAGLVRTTPKPRGPQTAPWR
ncbi:hypothetical protein QCA50_019266 [Cerrena zonata]|uniref:Uncharacterized protein n=1 Tax=Cerrena zonata TaxID=2478898 RepID=A0AAW0FE74_9APHY